MGFNNTFGYLLNKEAFMEIHFKFTETEIKKLLKENFIILHDTREQTNQHILEYFDEKKFKHKERAISEGDYTAIITKRPEMGIMHDLSFNVAIERKNSVDELAGNIGEEKGDSRDLSRLEREFQRARGKKIQMYLLIEDKDGKENILSNNYRSQISPAALIGKLSSFEVNYLRGVIYEDKIKAGREIKRILYYAVMESLKDKNYDIIPEELNEAEVN